MDVDPGQVDRDSTSCSVELGSRRRQRLRPGSFVPAVADDDLHIRMMSGVGCDPFNGVVPAPHIVQAEACHDLAGLDEMHMGIDESRSEQPSTKINFGLLRALSVGLPSSLPTKLIRPPSVTTAVAPGWSGA